MQLFRLIGQSNMAGRGIVGPQDQVTNPRIFMLTRLSQLAAKNEKIRASGAREPA